MPREFALYTNHKALQYLGSQNKSNQTHMKWVEYMQNFSFMLKHNTGYSNKVENTLSRRSLLTKMRVEVLGFEI